MGPDLVKKYDIPIDQVRKNIAAGMHPVTGKPIKAVLAHRLTLAQVKELAKK